MKILAITFALGQDFIHGKPPIRKSFNDLRGKELIGLFQHALVRYVLDKRGHHFCIFVPSFSYLTSPF